MLRVVSLWLLLAVTAFGAVPRVLYITTSAGYRHDSLPVSVEALRSVGTRTGLFELMHTEDLSVINAESLRGFQAVLVYTSGELPLSDSQKSALLQWVRLGGSFGGFHSATDTLYSWASYGELIGAYFDGHPWTQRANVMVTAPEHPVVAGLPHPFPWSLVEEYYQFRDFSPQRSQVLLALDKSSVDLAAPGVKATEFPLAWVHSYGAGRVFYTALGHFEGTWTDHLFVRLLENAMRYLLRSSSIVIDAVGNAASMQPVDAIAPGALISIYGRNLGGRVLIDGETAVALFVSGAQVNARAPEKLSAGRIVVTNEAGESAERGLRVVDATPGVFAATTQPGVITLWMTGLGGLSEYTATVGRSAAKVLYAGPAPGFAGLDQMNIEVPAGTSSGVQRIEILLRDRPAAGISVFLQ